MGRQVGHHARRRRVLRTVATLGIAALVALGLARAAAPAARDANGGLTSAQIARLQTVTAWDVTYTETDSVKGDGTFSGGPSSTGQAISSSASYSDVFSLTSSFTAVSSNTDGCTFINICAPSLDHPVQASFTHDMHQSDATTLTKECGTIFAPEDGSASRTVDFSDSASFANSDFTPGYFTASFQRGLYVLYGPDGPTIDGRFYLPDKLFPRAQTYDIQSCAHQAVHTVSDRNEATQLWQGQAGAVTLEGGLFVSSGTTTEKVTSPRPCIEPSGTFSCLYWEFPVFGDAMTLTHEHTFRWTIREHSECRPVPADELLDSNGNPNPAVADRLPDTDGDGIPDCWETTGIPIKKANGDVLTVPLAGADPQHKDIFVEVDYMQGQRPVDGALFDVVGAFARAPVVNPDGSAGVNLHTIVDDSETIPDIVSLGFLPRNLNTRPVDFWTLKSGDPHLPCDGNFGSAADHSSPNCALILAAKQLVYHYALFGDGALNEATNAPSGRGGVSEEGGNDLNITLGQWSQEGIAAATGLRSSVARTFMHELGHNLGLDHGGDQIEPTVDDPTHSHNCKPNYLSVMNYVYADRVAGLTPNLPLDYSRAALPTLNQDQLDEQMGIGGPPEWQVLYGVGGTLHAAPADGPVDWNGDKIFTAPVIGEGDWLADIGDCQLSARNYVSGNTVVLHSGVLLDVGSVPPVSAFVATAGGGALTVTSVAVVDDSVRLTLATSPNTAHVVYTRPAVHPLRQADGTLAPNFGLDFDVRPVLKGYDDWAHLNFNFRDTNPNSFADGIGALAHPNTPDVTSAQVIALARAAASPAAPFIPPVTPSSAPPAARARADLAVRVSGGQSLALGKSLSYTITVSNTGPDAASNVSLRDVIAAPVAVTSAISSQGSCTGSSTVICSLGPIASGAYATVVLTVTGTHRGPASSGFSVSAAEDDPSSGNNAASVAVAVHAAPVLVRAGAGFVPPLVLQRGRHAGSVATTLSLDESALVNVRLVDESRASRLVLLPGSRLGDVLSRRAHKSLTQSAGTAPLNVRLLVPLRALVRGHRYVILATALDSAGDSSELRLLVRY